MLALLRMLLNGLDVVLKVLNPIGNHIALRYFNTRANATSSMAAMGSFLEQVVPGWCVAKSKNSMVSTPVTRQYMINFFIRCVLEFMYMFHGGNNRLRDGTMHILIIDKVVPDSSPA